MIAAMRIFMGAGLVFVLGCSRSGADADAPGTGASEVVAPVEAEPPPNVEAVEAAVVDPSLCVPASYDQWPTCEGKRVQVDGRNPEMVHQHPMMNGPDTEQGYLDVDGGAQIVLVTREVVTCKGAMRVVGTLRATDLGGAPGTKESYQGWVIEDAEVTCR
jgi:hypothetical protein